MALSQNTRNELESALGQVASNEVVDAIQGTVNTTSIVADGGVFSTIITVGLGVAMTPTALTLANGVNIVCGSGAGSKIGTAAGQKIGFFNATPVAQRTFVPAPTGGATTDAEARTAINSIRTILSDLGFMAAS
jgi:hypothetical protein